VSTFQSMFSFGEGDEHAEPRHEAPPPWFGPPEDELGEAVPTPCVIGSSDQAVVALRNVTAFTSGLVFHLVAAARGLFERDAQRLIQEQRVFAGEETQPDAFLRIGVELADGARASNLGRPVFTWSTDKTPIEPVFSPRGGSGGGGVGGTILLDQSYWLWPLPDPGALRIFAEWPAVGIGLSEIELAAEPLLEAARRSQALWPDART
jgi:hypothetical protein